LHTGAVVLAASGKIGGDGGMKKISYEEFEKLLERHDSFDFCEANPDYYQRVVLVDKTVYVEDEKEDIAYVLTFKKEAEAEHFFKTLQELSRLLDQDMTLATDLLRELYQNSDVMEDAIYLFGLFIEELKRRCNASSLVDLDNYIISHGLDSDTLNYAEETAIAKARRNPAFIDCDATYELFNSLKYFWCW